MSTTRAFAYNTGGAISDTTQVGDIAIASDNTIDYSKNYGGVKWWEGPDEDLGYVIALPSSGITQPTQISIDEIILSNTYIGHDIQLTNNSQTARQAFGYQQTVLGNREINGADMVMFSVLCTLSAPSTLPDTHFIGFGNRSMNYISDPPYGAFPGSDQQSMGYCSNGNIYYGNNIYTGGFSTWGDGDIIDIAINSSTSTCWVRVNGGYWCNDASYDPATSYGGFEIIGGPFYPALCPGYEGTMAIQNTALYSVPNDYTFLGGTTAGVKFKRSKGLTDSAFLDLVNNVFKQNFTGATEANNYITTNNYWTSYGGFTIYTFDIVNEYTIGGGITINSLGNFTISSDNNIGNGYQFNPSVEAIANITTAFTINGFDINQPYAWYVTWASGQSGIVRMGYNSNPNLINISVVDTSVSNWQTNYIYNNGSALAGTFAFPATFVPYYPATQLGTNSSWC